MANRFDEKLKEIIVSCGGEIDIEKINEDTDLIRDFDFNSINIVQLVVQLESTFGIELDNESLLLEKLSTYKGLVDILKAKLDEDNIW